MVQIKKKKMKKILNLIFLLLAIPCTSVAQEVKFEFKPRTAVSLSLQKIMEKNISKLLTILNTAGNAGSDTLIIPASIIESNAKARLDVFWKNMEFSITDSEIVGACLETRSGYEVRQIPILLNPNNKIDEKQMFRELTILLNKNGRITGVNMALSNNEITSVLAGAEGVTDVTRRMEIAHFVEMLRLSYIQKDTSVLNKLFSDDAIIISGTVLKSGGKTNLETDAVKVKYRRENKQEYINRMANYVFKSNKFIDVKFDQISIFHSNTKKSNFYGVTLHQDWSSIRYGDQNANANHPSYQDEGWVFLLWEFPDDGSDPIIHVRTWQPDELIKTGVDKIGPLDLNIF